MAELGDLIQTFDDFKINFKELIEEIKELNTNLSEIKKSLVRIDDNVDAIRALYLLKGGVREVETEIETKKKKKSAPARTGITSKQYNYIYHLVQQLSDLTKKSPEEIGKQLMKKYKKKLTEFSVDEASQLIEYLKKRIKEEKAKWMG